jgi:ABC-type nitrate/sulfonate/bicarbonate transport system substrate-binding protein
VTDTTLDVSRRMQIMTRLAARFSAALLPLVLAWSCVPAQAETPPDHLTVNVFPGGFNWPLFVARDKGLFAQHHLAVDIQPTTGSVAQMSGLATGKFEIAMTAVDNIVAYVEGEGDKSVGQQKGFMAFMGSDSGFLSLVSAPSIAAPAGLKGTKISVDALSTGYAFVLYDMLAKEGLTKNDYTITPVGGMIQRWTDMQEGKHVATLLSTPYDILAKAKGFHQLAWATDVIGPYQGNVAATRRDWAATHRAQMVGYVQAYAAAIDWLYAPEHRSEAIEILRHNLPTMSQDLAEQTYGELLDPNAGFFKGAKVNLEGLQTVLRLRSTYAGGPKLTDPSRYYDPSVWTEAMTHGH